MNKHRSHLSSNTVGDVSSKYGLEPNKFDEDMQRHKERRQKKKREIYTFLEEVIRNKREDYKLIIESLIELRDVYDIE